MAISFGQIARRVADALHIERPPKDGVHLINGGPNAPHLACRPKDWSEGQIVPGETWQAQVKVDGIRCLYIDGRLVTLEGQPLNAARHCLADLEALQRFYDEPMFFDGEYVEESGFESTVTAYRKGEGQGTIWLFDAVPLGEWREDKCTATWRQRHAQLMLNHKAIVSPFLGALSAFPVRDDVEARQLFARMREANHEGIVLKHPASLYRRQTSDDWLRLKVADFTDMRLVDIEGNEKLGAKRLVCRDPVGGQPVILTAGFSSERQLIWQNRDVLLGHDLETGGTCNSVLVEVKHNGRTGNGRPRHAVFSKLRQDKAPPAKGAR